MRIYLVGPCLLLRDVQFKGVECVSEFVINGVGTSKSMTYLSLLTAILLVY